MDLSIITVTWNSADKIEDQMRSVVSGCKKISFEQIIVDNASSDTTTACVENNFPRAIIIKNTENKGFGAANNQAAWIAQGRYMLFLNPDMHVAEGSLYTMVEWMDKRTDIGLASCKLVDIFGAINLEATPRRLPTLLDQLAIILKVPHLFPKILDNYFYRDKDFNIEQEVDSVRGAFMIIRREVVEKLGWAFDPRYYFWFEDVDICREVKRLGYAVVHTPTVSCIDYVGQSIKKRDSLWKQKQFTTSMIIYFKKWEAPWQWVMIAVLRPIGLFFTWIRAWYKS